MSYIVMAIDECGEECRPSDQAHATFDGAFAEKDELLNEHCEYRYLWVEELRDKDYYLRTRLAMEEY